LLNCIRHSDTACTSYSIMTCRRYCASRQEHVNIVKIHELCRKMMYVCTRTAMECVKQVALCVTTNGLMIIWCHVHAQDKRAHAEAMKIGNLA
jgi:hypothetical protein